MNYNKLANFYDIISQLWTIGRIKRIRSKMVALIPKNSKVLELGCGTGHMSKRISNKVNCYLGLDSSDKMINIAKKENFGHNISFENSDVFNFNKFSNYNVIILSVFLCALSIDSSEKLIKKISKNFKGNVILYEENPPKNNLIGAFYRYSRFFCRYLFHFTSGDPLEPIHNFKKLFLDNGFKLEKEYYFFNNFRCVLYFEI